MDFITIDFETATSQRNSPCELGLTFVENGFVKETRSWLIKPFYTEFNPFNIGIHGIRPEDVADKPEFGVLWNEIQPLLKDKFLIAHNAGFDLSVLRSTLELYDLPFPSLSYSCSYIFSKKAWPGLAAYDLKTLCRRNGIPLKHHRAAEDSRATAELSLKAFQSVGLGTLEELPDKLQVSIGKLYNGGYLPAVTKRLYSPSAPVIGDPAKHDPDNLFYGKTVVFTGTLSSMVRSKAQQKIADIGGVIGNTVTAGTDFLIVGQQDYRVVGDDGMSSKQEKAVKLIEKGAAIEIVSEDEFLRNI